MRQFDKAKDSITVEQLTEWVIHDSCKVCPLYRKCGFMVFCADACREKVKAFYESEVEEEQNLEEIEREVNTSE